MSWLKTHGFDSFGDSAGEFCGYSVDYAKSSRSTCKKCKHKIAQGRLRIGTNFYGAGDYLQPSWRHYKCHGAGCFSVIESASDMKGYELLKKKDQTLMDAYFHGGPLPEADDSEGESSEAEKKPAKPASTKKSAAKKKKAKKPPAKTSAKKKSAKKRKATAETTTEEPKAKKTKATGKKSARLQAKAKKKHAPGP